MNVSLWRAAPGFMGVVVGAVALAVLSVAASAADSKGATAFKDCRECPEMVTIPPGTFTMGSPEAEKSRAKSEGPTHEVTIGRAFALSKMMITRDEYERFVRETRRPADKACEFWDKPTPNNWILDEKRDWKRPGFPQTGNDPVVCVSWDDASDYVAWLNHKAGRHHGVGPYRLPTEAEWEYAARAGTTTPYWQGEELGKGAADCAECGSKWDGKSTAPVGSFPANPWGLSDVSGNAGEWVADCWHESYADAPKDGEAWVGGNCAVRGVRGGAFIWNLPELRVAARYRWPQAGANYSIGFRVARSLDDKAH